MKILVINCGSATVKFRLFKTQEQDEISSLAGGIVSGLGKENAQISYQSPGFHFEQQLNRPGYREAIQAAIECLTHPKYGVLRDVSEIDAAGHRTVHGGTKFTHSVLVDRDVITEMEQCSHLAPLHNPANLAGINQAMALLPKTPQVAVFDTAFHQTIPLHASLYAMPYEIYETYGIRKYGFHGTSCQYIVHRASRLLGKPAEEMRMVICHLGNGVSVTAVKNGHSVENSLGFTSLEGAIMGTRCGALDPGVILYLMTELNFSAEQVYNMLYYKSGLLGISGVSNDMRTITDLAEEGNPRCRLAIEMFAYRLKKYIGSYIAVMGGIDLLVFTGGIGENSPIVRSLAVEELGFLGIEIDPELNEKALAVESLIHRKPCLVAIAVIPTNEEWMIAKETLEVLAARDIKNAIEKGREVLKELSS